MNDHDHDHDHDGSAVVNRDTLREEWLQALESDEYQQGEGNLCYKDHYCCLGVACEILVRHNLLRRRVHDDFGGRTQYGPIYGEVEGDWRGDILPPSARGLLGLRSDSGASQNHRVRSLLAMNDDGVPFTEIAATIRVNMDLYFELDGEA